MSRSLTSKCFQPHTALLLGPAWHFSALSLWGCNINKASLKVHQLLKLSWSLPITVTTQCVQHKNMFSLYNSQQTWHKEDREQTRAVGDTVCWEVETPYKHLLMYNNHKAANTLTLVRGCRSRLRQCRGRCMKTSRKAGLHPLVCVLL